MPRARDPESGFEASAGKTSDLAIARVMLSELTANAHGPGQPLRVNMADAQVSYEVPVEYQFNCEILESLVGKAELMDT